MHSTSSLRCSQGQRLGGQPRLPSAVVPKLSSSRRRSLQVATTEMVTRETQTQQPKSSSWSPWKMLNPFGGKKQQAEQLATISEAELWQLLEAEQEVPLVVIFSATWCGPCKIMVQRLESLMKSLGPSGIKAVKIDTDACPDLATELKVHKLPTLFFIGPDSSKPAAHYTGLLPESVMQDMVQNRRQFLGTDIRKSLGI